MKKFTLGCLLATTLLSTSAFAKIEIDLENVKSDAHVFVQSLEDGMVHAAIRAGHTAVVSDDRLSSYKEGSKFTVGIYSHFTIEYCSVSETSSSQFYFYYNKLSTHIRLAYKEKEDKSLVPVCESIS